MWVGINFPSYCHGFSVHTSISKLCPDLSLQITTTFIQNESLSISSTLSISPITLFFCGILRFSIVCTKSSDSASKSASPTVSHPSTKLLKWSFMASTSSSGKLLSSDYKLSQSFFMASSTFWGSSAPHRPSIFFSLRLSLRNFTSAISNFQSFNL